ncbi:MAG: hypothetical protein QXD62_02915 [Candidatus Woesearchaeota archaeon]
MIALKLKNKSQTEMFGLVVLVVIILIFFLIFLNFSLRKAPSSVEKDYRSQIISTTFISSLLPVNTNCTVDGQYTFQDLIELCAGTIARNILCDFQQDPCTYVKEQLNLLLNYTLNTSFYSYYFIIENPDGDKYFEVNNNCRNRQELRTQPYLLPISLGTGDFIKIYLYICN